MRLETITSGLDAARLSDDDHAPHRVLGSFELTFDSDWRIALTYLDMLERWETEQSNPLAHYVLRSRSDTLAVSGR